MNDVFMLDPAIGAVLVGCFVVLFASAAIHKLRHLQQFAHVFAGYGIASLLHRRQLSWLIPLLEVLIAAGLLLPTTRDAAAALGAALLLGYALAIRRNLRAGRKLVACGCGGPGQGRPIAGWMVTRNLLLAAALGAAALPWQARPLQWIDTTTIAFGVTAMALLYASAERLLGDLGQARTAGSGGLA